MSSAPEPPPTTTVSYRGEVWTDARGYATARLPADAAELAQPLDYELRDLDGQNAVRVTAELKDGRFTIASDQPHVKVAWRLTGHRRAGDRRQRQPDREANK
jgi:hypothetical protein